MRACVLTLNGIIAIGVHGGHDVYACAVDQPGDLRVAAIVMAQVFDEVQQQLAAHHLVAVHVAHMLELWLTWRTKGNMERKREIIDAITKAKCCMIWY